MLLTECNYSSENAYLKVLELFGIGGGHYYPPTTGTTEISCFDPVNNSVQMVCQRFLNDLEHGPERGTYFSEDRAQHILVFYNFVPHVKGALAGKPIELMAWHVFILINIFGFVIPLIDELN